MLWDSHIHTQFSHDSEALPIDIIYSAKKEGLCGITFTDHVDIDAPGYPEPITFDFDDYYLSMDSFRKSLSDDSFAICIGMELGLMPHLKDTFLSALSKYEFDYTIGSLHVVCGCDPYLPEYFENLGVDKGCTRYYEDFIENINNFPYFNSLGHLDYVIRYAKRFCENNNLPFLPPDCCNLTDEIFKLIISKDIALEVNTAGYRYGLNAPNPSFDLIKRYKELGGKMLTLGSDAHTHEHVGHNFENVKAKLKELGFNSFFVFKKNIPQEYPLE